jgi:glycosyltransferase 2 family protein
VRRLAGSIWFRALVSVGLLAFVASRIDFGAAGDRLSGGRWGYFAAAVAALFASFLLGGGRWHVFLGAAGIDRSLREAIGAYLIGTFTTNFLPTQVGGDVTRAWVASRPGLRVRTAVTVVVDRVSAIVCLAIVAVIALAADPGPVPRFLIGALGAAVGGLAIASFVAALFVRGATGVGRLLGDRLRGWADDARRGARACLRPTVVRKTLVLGVAFQVLVVLALWLLARAISLGVPFSVLAVMLPPVLIATAAPVSIGGFGVREGMFVLLLRHAGVGTTDATLLSLMSAAAFAVASLPGGLMLLRRGTSAPVRTSGRW